MNAESKGDIYTYLNVYKWFTETSGLGLMEQVKKLLHPPAMKSEAETTARVDEWVENAADWRSTVRNMN